MKYPGSKKKLSRLIIPEIFKSDTKSKIYIEPFLGGFNMIESILKLGIDFDQIILNDQNKYLISMYQALKDGWIPEDYYTREFHSEVRNNKSKYPDYLVGYLGFACSYNGIFFGGFVGKYITKNGKFRNYQDEAKRSLLRIVPHLKKSNLILLNRSYETLDIPSIQDVIIYCDPPYKDSDLYHKRSSDEVLKFDHDRFYKWCRLMALKDNVELYLSERVAPKEFLTIREFNIFINQLKHSQNIKGEILNEKLFTLMRELL